jgi:hypothetical protein
LLFAPTLAPLSRGRGRRCRPAAVVPPRAAGVVLGSGVLLYASYYCALAFFRETDRWAEQTFASSHSRAPSLSARAAHSDPRRAAMAEAGEQTIAKRLARSPARARAFAVAFSRESQLNRNATSSLRWARSTLMRELRG